LLSRSNDNEEYESNYFMVSAVHSLLSIEYKQEEEKDLD